MFEEYSVVRIVELKTANRPFDGTQTVMKPPKVGDSGTIVDIVTNPKEIIYIVEKVNASGQTIWLADFYQEEIELLVDPNSTEQYEDKLMDIQYKGHITKNDFLKCLKVVSSRQFKWQKRLFGFILALITCSILFSLLQVSSEATASARLLKPNNIAVLLIPIGILSSPWWIPYLQMSAYNQKANIYRTEVYGTASENEITINNDEVTAVFQWGAYTEYKIDKELLILFQGKKAFNLFKEDMFDNTGEWEKFISLVKDKLS